MALPSVITDREYEKFVEPVEGTTAVRVSHQIASYLGTINIGSAKALGTLTSPINGLVRSITQVTPTFASIVATVNTSLVDSSLGTIIAIPAQVESVIVTTGTIQPIDTSMKFIAVSTGNANGTVTTAGGVDIVLNVHYEL
jgi:hypothetical protein